jgi:serine/threonine protein kinase
MGSPGEPPGRAGTVIAGRFQLIEALTAGRAATVWRARDMPGDRWVAVKLSPSLDTVQREGEVLDRFDHRNVVRLVGFGVDAGEAWLATEYAPGGSLLDRLARHGPMPPQLAVRAMTDVCRGLEHVHEQGVVHRVVAPQHVVVGADGGCSVIGFGRARRMTLQATLMYASPEALDRARLVDPRADVYAIAATTYALVRGSGDARLFEAGACAFDGVPAELAAVIRKGAAARAEQRYPTVKALRSALEQRVHDLPDDPADTPPLASR